MNGDRNQKPAATEAVTWRTQLLARPVRNAAAEVEERPEGGVRIRIRKRRPAFLVPPLSWVIRPRLTRRFELDRVGARVWALCNGDRTVESIVEEVASAYGLSFHESRASVTGYLRGLIQRGALAIVAANDSHN